MLAETTFDSFSPLNQYIKKILSHCIKCDDSSIQIRGKKIITSERSKTITVIIPSTEGICHASLLDLSGEVPARSGLNWGLSSGHTTLGDAYIRINKNYIRENPSLFPPKQLKPLSLTLGARKTRQNEAVEFVWDDGAIMEGLLEQTQEIDGVLYPKAISSSPRKNTLGKYLR